MLEVVAIGAIGTTVVVATIAETRLMKTGKHIESELIHDITRFVLGGFTLGSFFFVAWQLVKMFILGA